MKNSRTVKRNRKFTALFAIALTSVLAVLPMSPAHASPTDPCSSWMVVIGVRGTNAPSGSNPGPGGRVWRSGGYSDYVAAVMDRLGAGNAAVIDGMYKVSLIYPARSEVNLIDSRGAYINSRNAGVAALKAELESYASCERRPSVTRVGYSQGADVIGTTLGAPLENDARAYVQGAVLFGDPSYRPNQPINAPGLNPRSSGMFSLSRSESTQETLNDMRSYGWNSDTAGMGWRQHVREYCNEGDAACQNNVVSGWGVHGEYEKWTQDAASFLNNFITPPG